MQIVYTYVYWLNGLFTPMFLAPMLLGLVINTLNIHLWNDTTYEKMIQSKFKHTAVGIIIILMVVVAKEVFFSVSISISFSIWILIVCFTFWILIVCLYVSTIESWCLLELFVCHSHAKVEYVIFTLPCYLLPCYL